MPVSILFSSAMSPRSASQSSSSSPRSTVVASHTVSPPIVQVLPLRFAAPLDANQPAFHARHALFGKTQEIKDLVWYMEYGGARNTMQCSVDLSAHCRSGGDVVVYASVQGCAGLPFKCIAQLAVNGRALKLDAQHRARLARNDADRLEVEFKLDQASYKTGNRAFRLEVASANGGGVLCVSEWVVVATKQPKPKSPRLPSGSPALAAAMTPLPAPEVVDAISLNAAPKRHVSADDHLRRADALKRQREQLEAEERAHRAKAEELRFDDDDELLFADAEAATRSLRNALAIAHAETSSPLPPALSTAVDHSSWLVADPSAAAGSDKAFNLFRWSSASILDDFELDLPHYF